MAWIEFGEPNLAGAWITSNAAQPQPILIELGELRPTQVTVGMRAVAARREKVERRARKEHKFDRYLSRKIFPTVLGPGGAHYIIDRHHLGLALCQIDVEAVFVEVIDDLSRLPVAQFWREMIRRGCAHPFDEHGCHVPPSDMPATLMDLRADAYRDLAWSVREAGGYEKTIVPFSEFRWAEFFRAHLPAETVRHDYAAAAKKAMRLARSDAARGLPGFCAAR